MLQLKPLYRHVFKYPEGWAIPVNGPNGTQSQHFYFAQGRCEGRIKGTLRGVNHPVQRTDLIMIADFQAVIETDDGAKIYCDVRGYGREYGHGIRKIVVTATHLTDDERYKWLNDTVCVGTGQVRALDAEGEVAGPSATTAVQPNREYRMDWLEVVWEPPAEE